MDARNYTKAAINESRKSRKGETTSRVKALAKAAKKREELEKKNQEAKEESKAKKKDQGKAKKKDEGKAKKKDEDKAKKKDEDKLNKEPVNVVDRKRRRVQYKQQILKHLNNLECAKRNVMKLLYDKSSDKFTIQVLYEDVVVILTKNLVRFLGFYKDTVFFHGSLTAPIAFDNHATKFMKIKDKIYLYDITNMEYETFNLTPSSTDRAERFAEIPIPIDDSKLSDKAKESPIEQYKFTMKINFKYFQAVVASETPIKQEHLKAYKKFALFSLDAETRKTLKLQPYSLFEIKLDDYKKTFGGVYEGLANRLQCMNGIAAKDLSVLELDQLRLKQMKITFYSLTAKEFKPYHRPTSRKRIVIDLSKSNIVGNAADSLNPVTTVSPIYHFSYDKSIQRFQLQVFPGHCLKLSESLASKLGFMNNYDKFFLESKVIAERFPNIKQAIREIYVYTNIIEPVFVGDVKAPLLLVCPFHNNEDSVHLQFTNPTYKKLNRKTFQKIDIGMYDAYGDLLRFSAGQTVFNLHFRKVPS